MITLRNILIACFLSLFEQVKSISHFQLIANAMLFLVDCL